jgi:co-chaperonin GroES (HSP10)
MKIKGTVVPLRDKVFVSDMNFGDQKTNSGLIIRSTDGKSSGIVPRWGRVWSVGSTQTDVKVGEWILIEHGRWTRTVEVENDDGSILKVRMIDNDAIMLVSDHQPQEEVYLA